MNKSFLAIDPLRLDEEWLNQPLLYFKYAERLAEARRVQDNASASFDAIYATLSNKIRRRLLKKKLKLTEGAIEISIQMQPEYKEAVRTKINSKYDVDILQSAVIALTQRKSALTELVELHLSSYYAEPRAKSSAGGNISADALQRRAAQRTIGKKRHREDE